MLIIPGQVECGKCKRREDTEVKYPIKGNRVETLTFSLPPGWGEARRLSFEAVQTGSNTFCEECRDSME